MKKTLLFLSFCLAAIGVSAEGISFETGKKYRIVCDEYGTGGLTLGTNHGSTALVYYDLTASTSTTDAWWYIEESGSGYTLQNASSKQYLYYEGTREEGVAKGIRLSTTAGETAQWSITQSGTSVVITNVAQSTHYINVRTDGTYLVGTYEESGAITNNEIFSIFDESGKNILAADESSKPDPVEYDNYGIDENGEYWELTGISDPYVLTSDTNDPVLYTIKNIRTGKYLYLTTYYGDYYYKVSQTTDHSQATQFYFVQNGAGTINVYTKDGCYIETYTWASYGSNVSDIMAYRGTASSGSDLWKVAFYNDATYPGYSFERQTDRSGGGYGGGSSSSYHFWNDNNSSTVCLYDCDGGSTFRLSSADDRHLENLVEQGIKFDGVNIKQRFINVVDSIRFDGKDLVYRKDTKGFMFNVRPKYRNGLTYTPNVEVRFKEGYEDCKLLIDGEALSAENTFDFEAISGQDSHELQVEQNGEVISTAPLNFTFLAIVEINVPSCNSSSYTTGTIRVNYFQAEGYDSTYIAAYKYRGASAQNYEKKSYAIKLRDENGNSVDREFLGYREDNNWILDAMAVDKACMRNRVSTDLWNDFSHEPYHKTQEKKARTGTRGRFVEVLLNGTYHGIYCMTEKMDRKQLKLKKSETTASTETIHGSLYKSSQWSYSVFFGHNIDNTNYQFPGSAPTSYNNNSKSENWDGISWEIKYPDYEDQAIDWAPLWNAVNFVATSDDYEFANSLAKYLDYPVLIDYYLYIELMLANDNHGKNMFYFNYDQKASTNREKLGIAVWDLDGTWGRRWDGNKSATENGSTTVLLPTLDFPTFLDQYEHGQLSYIYRLNKDIYLGWNDRLKSRYAELRGTFFKEEELVERFNYYAELFRLSAADQREQSRWSRYHSDLQGDVEYINDWISKRLAYLDEQYSYVPPVDGVSQITDKKYLGATGGVGDIEFHILEPQTVKVYDLSGKLIRSIRLEKGLTRVSGFQPGIYVANGTKVIVR